MCRFAEETMTRTVVLLGLLGLISVAACQSRTFKDLADGIGHTGDTGEGGAPDDTGPPPDDTGPPPDDTGEAACDFPDQWDDGSEIPEVPVEGCAHYDRAAGSGEFNPGLDWTTVDCTARRWRRTNDYKGGIQLITREVESFTITGTIPDNTYPAGYPPDTGIWWPPPGPPEGYVRLVALTYDDSPCNFTYPSDNNLHSGNEISAVQLEDTPTITTCSDALGTGWTTCWRVESTDVGNLNTDCPPEGCHWWDINTEFQSPRASAHLNCSQYSNGDGMQLCIYYEDPSAERGESTEANCAPGNGRFKLVPRRFYNYDDDSDYTAVLVPVQMTGTGRLTGGAWITDLNIVEDQGQNLRIMKPGKFTINSTDSLVDASTKSIPLQNTNDWPTGVVSGTAPIIGVELPNSTIANFEADLQWTCGNAEQVNHPKGYTFSMQDLGCEDPWVQTFTIRPMPFVDPVKLHFNRYGEAGDFLEVELLRNVDGDYDFDHVRGEMLIRGTITDFDSVNMHVDIHEISYDGINQCTIGTVIFPAED